MSNLAGTTTTFLGATVRLPRITFRFALKLTLTFWKAFFNRGPLVFNCDEVILHLPPPPKKETKLSNQPSAQFLIDLFTGWAGWVRKYGTDVIEVKTTLEPNTLMVIIHPDKFPDVEEGDAPKGDT